VNHLLIPMVTQIDSIVTVGVVRIQTPKLRHERGEGERGHQDMSGTIYGIA